MSLQGIALSPCAVLNGGALKCDSTVFPSVDGSIEQQVHAHIGLSSQFLSLTEQFSILRVSVPRFPFCKIQHRREENTLGMHQESLFISEAAPSRTLLMGVAQQSFSLRRDRGKPSGSGTGCVHSSSFRPPLRSAPCSPAHGCGVKRPFPKPHPKHSPPQFVPPVLVQAACYLPQLFSFLLLTPNTHLSLQPSGVVYKTTR